jgi:hypothetical protein
VGYPHGLELSAFHLSAEIVSVSPDFECKALKSFGLQVAKLDTETWVANGLFALLTGP